MGIALLDGGQDAGDFAHRRHPPAQRPPRDALTLIRERPAESGTGVRVEPAGSSDPFPPPDVADEYTIRPAASRRFFQDRARRRAVVGPALLSRPHTEA